MRTYKIAKLNAKVRQNFARFKFVDSEDRVPCIVCIATRDIIDENLKLRKRIEFIFIIFFLDCEKILHADYMLYRMFVLWHFVERVRVKCWREFTSRN